MERLAHVYRHTLSTTSYAGTLCGGEHGEILRTTALNWQLGKEQNMGCGLRTNDHMIAIYLPKAAAMGVEELLDLLIAQIESI